MELFTNILNVRKFGRVLNMQIRICYIFTTDIDYLLKSHPAANRFLTHAACPSFAASCKSVLPLWSLMSTAFLLEEVWIPCINSIVFPLTASLSNNELVISMTKRNFVQKLLYVWCNWLWFYFYIFDVISEKLWHQYLAFFSLTKWRCAFA